jgi:hypothetical protein
METLVNFSPPHDIDLTQSKWVDLWCFSSVLDPSQRSGHSLLMHFKFVLRCDAIAYDIHLSTMRKEDMCCFSR